MEWTSENANESLSIKDMAQLIKDKLGRAQSVAYFLDKSGQGSWQLWTVTVEIVTVLGDVLVLRSNKCHSENEAIQQVVDYFKDREVEDIYQWWVRAAKSPLHCVVAVGTAQWMREDSEEVVAATL